TKYNPEKKKDARHTQDSRGRSGTAQNAQAIDQLQENPVHPALIKQAKLLFQPPT
ncbi:hypothetical protein P7K49_018613, partial [Saguinus oedipus]